MMPGHEPGNTPAGVKAAPRDSAGEARHRRRQQIAAGAIAAGLALAVAVTAIGTPGHGHRAAPRVPGFSLPALGHPGDQISLADYAGRPVVVNFFASWCVPCKKETRCWPGSSARRGDG